MMTRKEAAAKGFVVDDTCYPWVAYKGPRFAPTEMHECLTDREADVLQFTQRTVLELLEELLQGAEHSYTDPDDYSGCNTTYTVDSERLRHNIQAKLEAMR